MILIKVTFWISIHNYKLFDLFDNRRLFLTALNCTQVDDKVDYRLGKLTNYKNQPKLYVFISGEI